MMLLPIRPLRYLFRARLPASPLRPVNNVVNLAITPPRFYSSVDPPGTNGNAAARLFDEQVFEEASTPTSDKPFNRAPGCTSAQAEDDPVTASEPPAHRTPKYTSNDAFVQEGDADSVDALDTAPQQKDQERVDNADGAQSSTNGLQKKKQSAKLAKAMTAQGKPAPLPRTLEALYLQPLRRVAKFGVPTCDLQLRSYSARNLEFFCDFALRAAYYAGLPSFGPIPLPRLTERWTVPKGHFIDKKSQENFERLTLRRLIQIRDGHPEAVQVWLAFLQKHQYYGVGMKANVWEFSSADVSKEMDKRTVEVSKALDKMWGHMALHPKFAKEHNVEELLATERLKAAGGR